MALTEAGIVQPVVQITGLPKPQASRAVKTFMASVKETLTSGAGSPMAGFGKFTQW